MCPGITVETLVLIVLLITDFQESNQTSEFATSVMNAGVDMGMTSQTLKHLPA